MIYFDTCIPPRLIGCPLSECTRKLTSTIQILILRIALVVAVDGSVIGVAVSDLVSILSVNTNVHVRVSIPTDVATNFLIVAFEASISIPIGTLALTQSMTREFPQ